MSDLIERLEKLSGPCRECDCRIWAANGHAAVPFDVAARIVPDFGQWLAPRYTSSIDAAMTLVPEGCMWNVGGNPNGGFASAGLFGAAIWQGIDQIQGEAPTPAIALCIAALKARNLP